MKHLYFCRHALSQYGVEGKWAGSGSNPPLAAKGEVQAGKAGQQAKKLSIDCIITSPLDRAYETARIIANEIDLPLSKIELSELLIERDFGELEGAQYEPDKLNKKVKGLESPESVIERARQALRYIESMEGENILIVSHGSLGRALRHVLNPDISFKKAAHFENAIIEKLL